MWCLQFILMLALIQHTPVTYGSYTYPPWAVAVGWVFALCSILPLPVIAIIKVVKSKGPLFKVCHGHIMTAPLFCCSSFLLFSLLFCLPKLGGCLAVLSPRCSIFAGEPDLYCWVRELGLPLSQNLVGKPKSQNFGAISNNFAT